MQRQPLAFAPFSSIKLFDPFPAQAIANTFTAPSGGGGSTNLTGTAPTTTTDSTEAAGTSVTGSLEPVRIATGPLPSRASAALGAS